MLSTSQLGADLDLDPCSRPPSIAHQPHNTSPLGLHHPAPNLALTPASSAPSSPLKNATRCPQGLHPTPAHSVHCAGQLTPEQQAHSRGTMQVLHCRDHKCTVGPRRSAFSSSLSTSSLHTRMKQPEQRCSACSTNLCTPPHQTQNQPNKDGRKSQNSKSAAPAE
jgi:hypothetical protein